MAQVGTVQYSKLSNFFKHLASIENESATFVVNLHGGNFAYSDNFYMNVVTKAEPPFTAWFPVPQGNFHNNYVHVPSYWYFNDQTLRCFAPDSVKEAVSCLYIQQKVCKSVFSPMNNRGRFLAKGTTDEKHARVSRFVQLKNRLHKYESGSNAFCMFHEIKGIQHQNRHQFFGLNKLTGAGEKATGIFHVPNDKNKPVLFISMRDLLSEMHHSAYGRSILIYSPDTYDKFVTMNDLFAPLNSKSNVHVVVMSCFGSVKEPTSIVDTIGKKMDNKYYELVSDKKRKANQASKNRRKNRRKKKQQKQKKEKNEKK